MENTLTVIIPVYNGMPYLKEAVESILRQTYTDFRLLIVDDGSTDASTEYLASLTDPRIEVRHQSNMGEAETCNRAVASVGTEFVAFLHQDDIAMPHRLQKQMDFLVGHPDYACVMSTLARRVGAKSVEYRELLGSPAVRDYESGAFGAITPSAFCFRKSAWMEVGGMRSSVGPGGDLDLLLRWEEKAKLAVFEEPLIQWRVHASASTMRGFYSYLIKSRYLYSMASLRRAGGSEISFEEYQEIENRASALIKLGRKMDARGKFNLRMAAIMFGEGRVFIGGWNLLGAFVLAPRNAFRKLLALRR